MKQVLIINASLLFQEFLKEKLTAEGIQVEITEGKRDAFPKIVSILPDLAIINLDALTDFAELADFFEKKKNDPNANRIPIIIAGPEIKRERVVPLREFGVLKYFAKPIKFDIFFESIGHSLKTGFAIDTTPAIIDVHINNNIIFIETALGFNREKISLLKYKLKDLIDKNQLQKPRIVLMMTDMSLCYADGINMELLLDNILADKRVEKANLKILTLDPFIHDFIEGHKEYSDIGISRDLPTILSSIVDDASSDNIAEIISNQLLSASDKVNEGSIEMKFYSDTGSPSDEDTGSLLRVAVIDDDIVIRKLLKATFSSISAECETFDSSTVFLSEINKKNYDIIVLDIFMPGISGFNILQALNEKNIKTPVIVYTQATQKDIVVKTLSLGAREYITKTQKPDVVVKKAFEILHAK